MKKCFSVLLTVALIFAAIPLNCTSERHIGLFSIESEAANISDLTFELIEGEESYAVSDCNESASGLLEIPSTYNGKPVTRIGDYAFAYCSQLTAVTIPGNINQIGYDAFHTCYKLAEINTTAANEKYSSLDGVLFNKDKTEIICCPAGKSGGYSIPDSVTIIGACAFSYCVKLTSITIPKSVTVISDDAFGDCVSILSMVIPDSVTSIGNMAFCYCSNLIEITLSNSLTSIGNEAFLECGRLLSVTLPNSLLHIGDYTFADCGNLRFVTLPGNIAHIGDHAFDNCHRQLSFYGFSESYPEDYADKNAINFIPISVLPSCSSSIDYESKYIIGEPKPETLDELLIADKTICLKTDSGMLGTGAVVKVIANETVKEEYTIIIRGDLNGDSTCDVLDLVLAERALNGHTELSKEQAYAANSEANSKIEISTYQNMVNKVLAG